MNERRGEGQRRCAGIREINGFEFPCHKTVVAPAVACDIADHDWADCDEEECEVCHDYDECWPSNMTVAECIEEEARLRNLEEGSEEWLAWKAYENKYGYIF